MSKCIGVLALQGGYALHQHALQSFGITAPLVYKPNELENLDGLIIPGGGIDRIIEADGATFLAASHS